MISPRGIFQHFSKPDLEKVSEMGIWKKEKRKEDVMTRLRTETLGSSFLSFFNTSAAAEEFPGETGYKFRLPHPHQPLHAVPPGPISQGEFNKRLNKNPSNE